MENNRLWSKNFVIINLCTMFASFTNYAYIYILPVHMLHIGGSNTMVGLMGAGLTIVGLITRLALSPLIDKWGRKPMLVMGVILFTLNSVGYLLLRNSVMGILIMRCFGGFTQGIFFPVPPTIISDVAPKGKLVDALGIFGIACSLPAILSPVLGMYFYENISITAFFIMTWLSNMISVGFSFFYKDEYKPVPKTEKRSFSLNSMLETSVIMPCIVFFLALFGFSAVNNFAIACGESRGIAGMSLFFTVHNIAIVATRLFAARFQKFIPSRKLIYAGLGVIGVGTLMMAFAGSFFMMVAASVIMGIGGTIYAQYLQADILLRVAEDRKGVATSTLMLFQDVGGGIGAAAFGVTSQYLGYGFTFIAAAAVTFLSMVFMAKDKNTAPRY